MQVYTADELILAVRDATASPNTASQGADDDRILKFLNQAQITKLIPEVLKLREEYYVVTSRTSLVSNTSRYRIPGRAMFQKLRSVYFIDGNNETRFMHLIQPEERYLFLRGTWPDRTGHYFEGNDIVLLPAVGSNVGGSLEFSFYFRPGDLVKTINARQIDIVNYGAKEVHFGTAIPTSWTALNTFDIHSNESGAEIKAYDMSASTVISQTIDFTTPIDGSVPGTRKVLVGDWVCLVGEAVIPGLPKELHPLLIDAAALRLLKAWGDPNLVTAAKIHAAETDSVKEVMEVREESKPMRVSGRRGLLRAGRIF